MCAPEQFVEIPCGVGVRSRVAASVPGAVVHAHLRRAGHLRSDDLRHVRGRLAEARLEHHRGASGADAADVEPMVADVDQPITRHAGRSAAGTRLDRLEGPSESADRHEREDRVQQPGAPGGCGLPADLDRHPHGEAEDRPAARPTRASSSVSAVGLEEDERESTHAQDGGGHRSPAVGAAATPCGEHRQERPADREPEQDRSGRPSFVAHRERPRDQRGGGEATRQGASRRRPSPRSDGPVFRWWRELLA